LRARTGLRGLLFSANGLNLLVGNASTVGVLQTQLAKNSRPPTKWSYLKLLGWFALVSFVALVSYVHSVMSNSAATSSLPVPTYIMVASSVLLILGFLFWRHNHFVYPREHAEWDRSFLCQRCGNVSAQPIDR
jgi:cytochrome c oxidase assembly factor CtaG